MPQYIFIYLGGDYPNNPEEGKKHFEEYHGWLSALGDAVISPAIPFKDTHTVHCNGKTEQGTTTLISGMSIMRFESMGVAIEAAKSCPFLKINGTLEVSEMVEMSKTVN